MCDGVCVSTLQPWACARICSSSTECLVLWREAVVGKGREGEQQSECYLNARCRDRGSDNTEKIC